MFDFLRLTRPLNLLIIAITMVAMRYGVIVGAFERSINALLAQFEGVARDQLTFIGTAPGPQLPLTDFVLLVLSTVLIAAGGNVINDYFDTRIDRINKPESLIVGRTVKRRVAMAGHFTLSGLGLLLGAFVAWHAHQFKLVLIPLFAIGSLWMYSTVLKRRFLIGNGVVALLTALVPITVALYEIPALRSAFADGTIVELPGGERFEMVPMFHELWWWIGAYAAFAFLSTLVRELQKDMADIKGDEAEGCRTVPIVLGVNWAKGFALLYIAGIIGGVLALRMFFLNDRLSYWYLGLAVMAPLLISGGFTFSATDRKGFLLAGNLMKVAMVMAVAYAVVIRYTM